MSLIVSPELVAQIRQELQIIVGNAGLIVEDSRAHPIIVAKAKLITKTVSKIADLLKSEETNERS